MNFRKLLKWSLVLVALLAYKELGGLKIDSDSKPVYLSTQEQHH